MLPTEAWHTQPITIERKQRLLFRIHLRVIRMRAAWTEALALVDMKAAVVIPVVETAMLPKCLCCCIRRWDYLGLSIT